MCWYFRPEQVSLANTAGISVLTINVIRPCIPQIGSSGTKKSSRRVRRVCLCSLARGGPLTLAVFPLTLTLTSAHCLFVFRLGHFADHPLDDIIEKIACQFTARHVRGRPRPPFWHPGWPLYVCDSRYNDRERVFVKIKNWNSCIPEEVRKKEEFMPIYSFERSVFPRRFPSPFLAAQKPPASAPGGILEVSEKAEKEKEREREKGEKLQDGEKADSGGVGGRPKRPKRAAVAKAEQERAAAKGNATPGTSTPQASPATVQHQVLSQPVPVQLQVPYLMPPREDRSLVAAARGIAALGNHAVMEELPPETGTFTRTRVGMRKKGDVADCRPVAARLFDREPETNEVLWFAAPPVDIVHTPPPQHSLKYLAFLAKKRKAERGQSEDDQHVSMDVDGGGQSPASAPKRRKMPPTATETLEALMRESGLL